MPAQQQQWLSTCFLSDTEGTVAAGRVLCLDAAGGYYVVATSANRAAAGRNGAVLALTAGDGLINTAVEGQFVGVVPASIAGVGTGSAGEFIRVSSTGTLERVASPSGGDQIVGTADADGVCYINFAGAGGGSGGGTFPGNPNTSIQFNSAGTFAGETYWLRTALGVLTTNYINNGILDVGHINVVGNGETAGTASLPLDGVLRFSNQLAAINSVPVVVYQSNLLDTDPWVLGVDHGKPVFGDPTHLTEVDIIGDGVLIDAGAGGAGAVSSFTGEVQVNCKATTSAGGFTTVYFGFQSSGAPSKGVASFDGGNPSRFRSSIGSANQVLRTNASGTDIEWTGGASSTISALDIDWSSNTVFSKTLAAGSNTFTFSNAADGQTIVVKLTGAASTVTWPTVKWSGGTPPTQTASGTDIYTFVKIGTSIYGSVAPNMS